jgi:hypothetical protein
LVTECSSYLMTSPKTDSTHPSSFQTPHAFDRDFLDTFSRREPAPATPEADDAGPWRVTRLHGDGDPLWACMAAGERPPRFSFQEPDLAFLTATGLTVVEGRLTEGRAPTRPGRRGGRPLPVLGAAAEG